MTKCLVILEIRYEQYQHLTGPLQHRDMQTLALIPVDKSTGEIVSPVPAGTKEKGKAHEHRRRY